MPIRVKIANSPLELDALFKTRHRVFVEEEGYLKKRPDGRIFDQFDAFSTTVNIVAMVNKQVVGGLRITEWSDGGTPSDDFFDFRPYIPGKATKIATASMLCLQSEFRKFNRLCFMMLSMGTYWAISKKVSHTVAAINPLVERLLGSVGFQRLGSPFHDEAHGVDVLPMLLDVNQVGSNFLKMAEFQGFYGSLRTFDRELYRAGEKIIEGGTKSDTAYVIVDGHVAISRPGRRAGDPPDQVLSKLEPCEIFGEVALLTNKPRSADAYAMTDVDLMVIEREIFWEQLQGNPDLQLKLLQLFGHRLADTYEKLSVKPFQIAGNWV